MFWSQLYTFAHLWDYLIFWDIGEENLLIPFDNGLHNELAKNNEVHLFNTSVFFWNDFNRWNYKTNSPPPYSIYTAQWGSAPVVRGQIF